MAAKPNPEPLPGPPQLSLIELLRDLARHAMAYGRDLGTMAVAEIREKARFTRVAAASLAIAAIFALMGFLFLSVALVAAIAYGLKSWGWASLIVGVAYVVVAGLVVLPAARSLSRGRLRFTRTLNRVKQDARWIKDKLAA